MQAQKNFDEEILKSRNDEITLVEQSCNSLQNIDERDLEKINLKQELEGKENILKLNQIKYGEAKQVQFDLSRAKTKLQFEQEQVRKQCH